VESKKQHRNACEQIKAYYNLEMIYSEALFKESERARGTVLSEFRSHVEEATACSRLGPSAMRRNPSTDSAAPFLAAIPSLHCVTRAMAP
jgi:hypothetical protein